MTKKATKKIIAIISKFGLENGKPLGKNAVTITGVDESPNSEDLYKISVKEIENAIDKMLKK